MARFAVRFALFVMLAIGPHGAALAQEAVAAPRELSKAQQDRLKQKIDGDKAARDKAVANALANQRNIVRQQEDQARAAREAAYAAAQREDASQSEPEQPAQSVGAAMLSGFTSGFSSEFQKNMEIVNRGNADVAFARQRLIEQQQREERQREQQQKDAQLRQQQQRLADEQRRLAAGGGATNAPNAGAAEQQRLAQERQAEMQAQVAAERKRLTTEREQLAAEERARVMKPFVDSARSQQATAGTAGTALTGGTATAVPAAATAAAVADHGPARAWCQASEKRQYQCMGPLQRALSWESSLDHALSVVGCTGGQGYNPTPGHGGSGFNCGRQLQVGEYRMPTYDPYRGGGVPTRVTAPN